jgi:hypothetical protein
MHKCNLRHQLSAITYFFLAPVLLGCIFLSISSFNLGTIAFQPKFCTPNCEMVIDFQILRFDQRFSDPSHTSTTNPSIVALKVSTLLHKDNCGL